MEDNKKELTENLEITPEEKKKKRKKKFLAIFLPIISLFLVVVLVVGGFLLHKLSLVNIDNNESTTIDANQEFVDEEDETLDFAEMDDVTGNDFREILKNWATNGGDKMTSKDVTNILLIGSDASAEMPDRVNITEKGNTDVMMLVSIDEVNKKIKLVSFMRLNN